MKIYCLTNIGQFFVESKNIYKKREIILFFLIKLFFFISRKLLIEHNERINRIMLQRQEETVFNHSF